MHNIRFVFASICLLVFSFAAFGQDDATRIGWGQQLEWSDFSGPVPEDSPYSANTSSGISYSYTARGKRGGGMEFKFTVQAYFTPQGSWVKPDKKAEKLLQHERLHFDITEIYARLLRKYFTENSFNASNANEKIKQAFEQHQTWRAETQAKYDLETRHGTLADKQAEWDEKVKKGLADLENYK